METHRVGGLVVCLTAIIALAQGQITVTFADLTVSASPTGVDVPCTYTLTSPNTVKFIQIQRDSGGGFTDIAAYNQSDSTVYGDSRYSSSALAATTFTLKISDPLTTDGTPTITNYKCIVTDSTDATQESSMVLTIQVGCDSSPCQNNATCNDTNLANAWNYECTCPPDYVGANCETNVDQCASDPCKNGATCVDGTDAFSCTCTSCYEGDTCATKKVNYCANSPCKNGATCNDLCDQFTCDCPYNWKGTTCNAACANIASVTASKEVLLGSAVALECTVKTALGSGDKVYWSMKADGSKPYASTAKTSVTMTKAKVGVHYCFVEQGGCISRSNSTSLSYTYVLNVNETSYENITMTEGETRTLTCSATGNPPPTVQWFFVPAPRKMPEGEKEENSNVTTATTTLKPIITLAPKAVSNATLNVTTYSIFNAEVEDSGKYTCVASIAGGDVKMNVHEKQVTVIPQTITTGLKNWEIALIVIGVILFVALIIIIIVVVLWKTGKAGAICPSDKAGAAEKGDSAPYDKSRDTYSPKKKTRDLRDDGDDTDRADESPRPLPAPPAGRAPGHLPPLDMDAEKPKKKKKKIKKKKTEEDEERDSGNDEDNQQYGADY